MAMEDSEACTKEWGMNPSDISMSATHFEQPATTASGLVGQMQAAKHQVAIWLFSIMPPILPFAIRKRSLLQIRIDLEAFARYLLRNNLVYC